MNTTLKRIISVILSAILLFSVNLIAIAENEKSWKSKIDEKIYEQATNKDSVVSVYIWITDVDHEEVIAETENTLGYGEDDLAVIDENISEELAVAISNLSDKEDPTVKDELQQYMKKTEKKRKAEKEKTDKYISEKRSNYRDKYNKKSKDFLEKAKISDDEIIFRSQYAPMIIAELTLKQIEKVAKADEVENVRLYIPSRSIPCSTLSELISSSKIDEIHELGLTGQDVKVGIKDIGTINIEDVQLVQNPEFPNTRFEELLTPYEPSNNHVNLISQLGFGASGIAPGTKCYVSCSNMPYYETENLISKGVSIINHSCVSAVTESVDYNNEECWYDHLAAQHSVTFVQCAGNDYDIVYSPGRAYNIITVGAYNNNGTLSTSDDQMVKDSGYNSLGGCEKPDIIAPENIGDTGTSYSAAFVSGVIALMLELRPSLAAYPQAVKAILLASCHHKAAPASGDVAETMSQGITDKQGAGVVDPYRAISITARGSYGIRKMISGTTSMNINFYQPSYGSSGINVSIAWLRENTINGSHQSVDNVTAATAHDLDLTLKSGNNVLKSSSKSISSTEMVYYSGLSSYEEYTMKIDRISSSSGDVSLGYAWSIDSDRFQCMDEFEGIYYIKNKPSGYYLTINTQSNIITQSSYTGDDNQLWIIQASSDGKYRLNSICNNIGCLDLGELYGFPQYDIAIDNSNVADCSVWLNDDTSFSFVKTENGLNYALTTEGDLYSNNAEVKWEQIDDDVSSNCQKWWLEPYCYYRGDVDMNGRITAADSRAALAYSSSTEVLSNAGIFLADINNDKAVTAADSRTILRISSGLE